MARWWIHKRIIRAYIFTFIFIMVWFSRTFECRCRFTHTSFEILYLWLIEHLISHTNAVRWCYFVPFASSINPQINGMEKKNASNSSDYPLVAKTKFVSPSTDQYNIYPASNAIIITWARVEPKSAEKTFLIVAQKNTVQLREHSLNGP